MLESLTLIAILTYSKLLTNPLRLQSNVDLVESCADPSVIRGRQPGDKYWYMYCTTDPLNDQDKDRNDFNFRLLPTFRSLDLVNWTYVGDAFKTVPSWGDPTARMWAPKIDYFNGKYYLYYTVTDVKPAVSGEPAGCHDEKAIGVATSSSPTGPWTDLGRPVVEPRRAFRQPADYPCDYAWFWTIDPEVITANTQRYIYYGNYFGGIQVRQLSNDGFTAPAKTAVQVTIPNRYEGSMVVKRNGYYYLFVSATDCCRGPLTGYSIFVGRSKSPTGPFVDREGVSLLAGRVGGTPVLSMNGNRWVGPGHNTIFTDFNGQYWTIYHAVDRNDPYFASAPGFTKRHALLDRLDWINDWPTVRAGLWASDTPQIAPAAQPGEKNKSQDKPPDQPRLGKLIQSLSNEFNGVTLSPQWEWLRQPPTSMYKLTGNTFQFNTQAAELFVNNNTASVLTEPAPDGDYVVETRVKLNLPPEGCCFNFVQAGLVIYGSDNNYVKLVHASIWETRQTEFAKEVDSAQPPVPLTLLSPAHQWRYGNTVVGPPAEWTYLRVLKRTFNNEEEYTAYTSRDGKYWVRGGTWTHNLGVTARIGLVSMGGSGFVANFDYVRTYHYDRPYTR